MGFKNWAKTLVGTTLALMATKGTVTKGEDSFPVHGDIGFIQPVTRDPYGSYAEGNFSYKLPGVEGFTFMDFYTNEGAGYCGRTSLDKTLIADSIGPRVQAYHYNEPFSEGGVGIGIKIPSLPKDVFAKVNIMPVWINKEGKYDGKRAMIDYCFSMPLPKQFTLSGFGGWNLAKGSTWDYGEFELSRPIYKNIKLGIGTALESRGDRKALPEVAGRITLRVTF